MKRRFLAVLLTLGIVLGMVPAAFAAETVTYAYDQKNKTLIFSGVGPVGDETWQEWNDDGSMLDSAYKKVVQKIILEPGITSIGIHTFVGCTSLTSVTIPNSVTDIGTLAFAGCISLKNVTVPASVLRIGDHTFGYTYETVSWSADGAGTNMAGTSTRCEPLDGFTIYGYPGTAAERYAIANKFTFISLAPVSFTDVQDTAAWYYDAVQWAVANGVTTGTTGTTFSPLDSCTRAQAVTFLWRAAGSPEPASANNPFTDVSEGEYYYKAVLWAVEQGITKGTSETEFSPNATCNRAQIVTFLYRYEGAPDTEGSGFNDVPAGEYYYAPVIWAASKGVTDGTGEGSFSPMDNCTRGQIVTFLYRDMAK